MEKKRKVCESFKVLQRGERERANVATDELLEARMWKRAKGWEQLARHATDSEGAAVECENSNLQLHPKPKEHPPFPLSTSASIIIVTAAVTKLRLQ
jgi:hypothetical protein